REVPAPAPPPVPAPVPVQVPPVNPGNNNPPPAPPATDPEAPEKQDHQQPPVVVAEQHVGSITASDGSAAEQSQPLVGTEDVRPGQPPEDLKPRGEGSVTSVPAMTVERPATHGPLEPLGMRALDPLPILEKRVQPLTRKRRRWFRRRGGSASGSGGAEQPLGEMVN